MAAVESDDFDDATPTSDSQDGWESIVLTILIVIISKLNTPEWLFWR